MNTLNPASLLIGTAFQTKEAALKIIQSYECEKKGCGTCSVCLQIKEENHYSLVSIIPEKRYTLDTLEPIFKRTSFTLDEDSHCFFIIHKADFLSPACANSMLKIVEEPPPGYHFIFLAQRLTQVLPTIRSRCVIETLKSTQAQGEQDDFLKYFTGMIQDPLAFQKELSTTSLTEQESLVLADQLLAHWLLLYKRAVKNPNQAHQNKAQAMINIFKEALLLPPAPGSSKIFWKNIYLKSTTT